MTHEYIELTIWERDIRYFKMPSVHCMSQRVSLPYSTNWTHSSKGEKNFLDFSDRRK